MYTRAYIPDPSGLDTAITDCAPAVADGGIGGGLTCGRLVKLSFDSRVPLLPDGRLLPEELREQLDVSLKITTIRDYNLCRYNERGTKRFNIYLNTTYSNIVLR